MITHSLSPFLYSYPYFNTRKHSTRKLYLPPVMTPLYQKKNRHVLMGMVLKPMYLSLKFNVRSI